MSLFQKLQQKLQHDLLSSALIGEAVAMPRANDPLSPSCWWLMRNSRPLRCIDTTEKWWTKQPRHGLPTKVTWPDRTLPGPKPRSSSCLHKNLSKTSCATGVQVFKGQPLSDWCMIYIYIYHYTMLYLEVGSKHWPDQRIWGSVWFYMVQLGDKKASLCWWLQGLGLMKPPCRCGNQNSLSYVIWQPSGTEWSETTRTPQTCQLTPCNHTTVIHRWMRTCVIHSLRPLRPCMESKQH